MVGYMEDYVDGEDDGPMARALARSRGGAGNTSGTSNSAANKRLTGPSRGGPSTLERLALQWEEVEVSDDDDEAVRFDPKRPYHASLRIGGSGNASGLGLLQGPSHGKATDAFIPGFRPCCETSGAGIVVLQYYPPPQVGCLLKFAHCIYYLHSQEQHPRTSSQPSPFPSPLISAHIPLGIHGWCCQPAVLTISPMQGTCQWWQHGRKEGRAEQGR